jgi:hypothetical protein
VSPGWPQSYLLWGQGIGVSSLIAAIPTRLLLFMLAVKRKPAWQAALVGLAATMLLATTGYGMSLRMPLVRPPMGAAFGLFPINWIVFWAIALYRITVETGKFEIIKASIATITVDKRLQILLVAFAFGAFLERGRGLRNSGSGRGGHDDRSRLFRVIRFPHLPARQYRSGRFWSYRNSSDHPGGHYRLTGREAQRGRG